jgi:hypothetical protein
LLTTRRTFDITGSLSQVVLWLAVIVSGALTTSFLRAPLSNPAIGPATFTAHRLGGIAVAALLVVLVLPYRSRARGSRVRELAVQPAPRTWPVGRRLAAAFVTATAITGLIAGRSFAPSTAALHAWLAIVTAATLSAVTFPASSPGVRVRWTAIVAQLGLILMVLQAAIGAMLRHQLTSLGWHVLLAGIASIAVLVPAVSTLQRAEHDRRTLVCASLAIAATVTQVMLGTGVFALMVAGNPTVTLWVSTTTAHIVFGTLTVVATAVFAAALRA